MDEYKKIPQAPTKTLLHLPVELILSIIEELPVDDETIIQTLFHIHPHIRNILSQNERSLTKAFLRNNMRHALVDLPCRKHEAPGFSYLVRCVRDYNAVDDAMLLLRAFTDAHNMGLVYTGLLLLCRFASLPSPADKRAWMAALPRHPLMAMYLAIHTARHQLHCTGGLLRSHLGAADQRGRRIVAEAAFLEGCFEFGIAFIRDVLRGEKAAAAKVLEASPQVAGAGVVLVLDQEHDTHRGILPPDMQALRNATAADSLMLALRDRLEEVLGGAPPGWRVYDQVMNDVDDPRHDLSRLNRWDTDRLMEGKNVSD